MDLIYLEPEDTTRKMIDCNLRVSDAVGSQDRLPRPRHSVNGEKLAPGQPTQGRLDRLQLNTTVDLVKC